MEELLVTTRAWVVEHYAFNREHMLKTEEWMRRLRPDADLALLLAALTHDMERAFPGPDSPVQDLSLGIAHPTYNRLHGERSARVVATFLREQGADETLIAQVADLIAVHEDGGWPEADLVQAADSLSFLETNVDLFISWTPTAQKGWSRERVRDKFAYMYERIRYTPAREHALPLYEVALRRLDAFQA